MENTRLRNIGEGRKKEIIILFYQSFAEKSQKSISSICTQTRGKDHTYTKSNLSRSSKGNTNLNHRTWASRRDLEEDLRIIILVRKLNTAMTPNRTGRFDTDPVAVS